MPSERHDEPPQGIEILRADEIDPVFGRRDQWVFRGTVGARSIIRAGFGSRGAACRAARAACRSATLMDAEVAHDETPEPERWQPPPWTKPPNMRDEYTVKVGSWDVMAADLLSQILADAGSIRRAAKAVGLPKSTLAARVRDLIARGVWPTVR
jgi:hypothetical protein